MVDAHPDAGTHHPAHRRDQGSVSGRAQPAWVERRDTPVLARWIEVVGRSSDPRARGDHVLPQPRVRAVGREADSKVVDQGQLTSGTGELGVERPLQPAVEVDPRTIGLEQSANGATVSPSIPRRPRAPGAGVALGEDAEAGVALEQEALACDVGVEAGIATEARPERVERAQLQWHDQVAIDERRAPQALRVAHEPTDDGVIACAGEVLNPEVQRVSIEAAGREVRARLLGRARAHGVQRVDQEHRRAIPARPRPERAKIAEIADPPSVAGPHRIELRGPAPPTQRVRNRAPPRAGDHRHAAAVAHHEPVVSAWRVAAEEAAARKLGAALQLDATDPARQPGSWANERGRGLTTVDGAHARCNRARMPGAHPPASARRIHVLSLDSPDGAGHVGSPRSAKRVEP